MNETFNSLGSAICGRRCANIYAGICGPCSTWVLHDLRELPELYVTLSTLLAPSKGKAGGRVSGTPPKPIGLRADVFDLMRDIVDTLSLWADQVRDDHPDRLTGGRPLRLRRDRLVVVGPAGTATVKHPQDRNVAASTVLSTTSWLALRAPWIFEQSWSADFAEEVRDKAHAVRKLARLYDEEPDLKLGVPCSLCEFFTLVRDPGDVDVHCARSVCGRVYRPEEYEQWVAAYSQDPVVAMNSFEQAARLSQTADALDEDRRLRRHTLGLRAQARRLEEKSMDPTPVTQSGIEMYDHLTPAEAVLAAWSNPGSSPEWHERTQAIVRANMPVMARALDRLTAIADC